MCKKVFFLLILLFISALNCYSQNDFSILNDNKKESIHFKLVNNLILLPVTLNGEKLTFLLDTGVKKTLLFNVKTSDSIDLKQVKKVLIRGLGIDNEFEALESRNNLLTIQNVVCPNFELLVILDKKFDFSQRLGIDVHGIIGSELFKDFIIHVNYNSKRITFNNPKTFKYKRSKKWKAFPLKFHFQKPYIMASMHTSENQSYPLKLLLDSGGGDALWIFEKSLTNYKPPKKYFVDLLGKGLSGDIFGKKTKLKSFHIGDFKFNDLIIAHPDSSSTLSQNIHLNRNGLIGAEILKRFHIIYDYPNKQIFLKKNTKYFKSDFSYNKSGIEVIHYGQVLVKEQNSKLVLTGDENNNGYNLIKDFSTTTYSFKNAYQISYVKPNSLAKKAGIQKGDIIEKINDKPAYNFTLQQIIQKLSGKSGKRIKIKVFRN